MMFYRLGRVNMSIKIILKVSLVSALMFTAACAPSVSDVEKRASQSLSDKLHSDYPAENITIKDVSAVLTSKNHFEGTAHATMYGKDFDIPLGITSDGKTTIIYPDESKVDAQISAHREALLDVLKGKYSDSILEPQLTSFFPDSLKKHVDEFKGRLETVVPIEATNYYYFGSGGKAHSFGSDEAAWAIDRTNGHLSAITMVSSEWAGGISIAYHLYGGTLDSLPPPLLQWAIEHGVNQDNSVNMDIEAPH